MRLTRTLAVIVAIALFASPAIAAAQEPVRDFDQLNTRLKPGDTVWVTDGQGREVKGRIRDLGPSALTLDRGGMETILADAVRLIAEGKPRPIARGALWGLGVGAASGLAMGIAVVADCNEGDECNAAIPLLAAFLGGVGAGTGALIGALMPGKKTVVYRAPGTTGSSQSRLSIAPVITPRAKGVALSFAF